MYRPVILVLKDFISHKDTVFNFQNKPLLLVGENKDDSSQKGNGSGKSAIIEAISYLITGSTIRSVKDRELIRDNCESCSISITLNNNFTKELLVIERTLHITKSSTCSITINGENFVQSSVNEYNSFILKKLGFSKEDFWNFFLITKERYTSFLSSTDTSKKQIINRFSKADLLDQLPIKSRVQEYLVSKTNLERELSKLEGQLEVLQEEILSFPKKEELLSKIEILESEILKIDNELKILDDEKYQNKKSKVELESEMNSLDSELSKLSSEREVESVQITTTLKSEKSSELEIVDKSFEGDFKDMLEIESKLRLSIINSKNSLEREKELEQSTSQRISSLKTKLSGTISCPKCEHKFVLDSEYVVDDLNLMLNSFIEDLNEITLKVNKFTLEISSNENSLDTISNTRESLKKQIEEIKSGIEKSFEIKSQQQYESLQSKYVEKQSNLKKSIYDLNSKISSLKLNFESLESRTDSFNTERRLKNSDIVELKSKIEKLENDERSKRITTIENQKLTKSKEIELISSKIEELLVWELRFKKFRSYLSNLSLSSIKDMTNSYLKRLGSNLTIDLEGYKELSSGKMKEEIVCNVIRDGHITSSYGRYSSGERGRVDISSILSLQHLINLSSESGGIDLLVIDEVLDSIDSLGITSILKSLVSFEKNIILVSQNDILSLESNTVIITKENRISQIV